MLSPDVRSPRRALVLALALSCALHAVLGWLVAVVLKAPDLGIEFEVPIDIELGLTTEMAGFAPAAAPAPPVPDGPAEASADKLTPEDEEREQAKRDKAKVEDAGPQEPALADAGVPDAGELLADPSALPGSRVPPGAQIAIRVNMTRIRASAVADDIRGLLAAVPDWKALLDGSGIHPVDQLDRLLIATPNLQRAKLVLAGRFIGEPTIVDEAVRRLAEAQGVSATWTTRGGVRVAPWANPDATPRVIALVGPSHFTISRPEDLPRVLAIAAARATGDKDAGSDVHPADALLSMEENAGLSLEVEGVEQFVRKAKRGIPEKLRLSAFEIPGPRVELRGRLAFADAEMAADAARFWSAVRDSYARNALVALLGLSGPLREATIEPEEDELRVKAVLSVEQTRLIIGYVRELITPPPPIPGAPPARTGQAQGSSTRSSFDPSGAPGP